jgi:hypothetical protein
VQIDKLDRISTATVIWYLHVDQIRLFVWIHEEKRGCSNDSSRKQLLIFKVVSGWVDSTRTNGLVCQMCSLEPDCRNFNSVTFGSVLLSVSLNRIQCRLEPSAAPN